MIIANLTPADILRWFVYVLTFSFILSFIFQLVSDFFRSVR